MSAANKGNGKPSDEARAIIEPEDHKSPAEAEAVGDEFTFVEFDGTKFTFPTDSMLWTVATRRAFRHGQIEDGLELLLGEQCSAAGVDNWTGKKFSELFHVVAKAAGFATAGES